MTPEPIDPYADLHAFAPACQPRTRARRVRRRAGIGAAVAILLVSASIALLRLPDRPVAPATPTPTVSGAARIDGVPMAIPPDPELSPFWPATLNPPADAPTLAQAPLSHALLLFQPRGTGPIYAYGEGSVNGGSGNGTFGWVRLDVPLTDTHDADGNRVTPLNPASLGPMGERAAFAQPDEFVVVDLRTGEVRRTPLPGLNKDIAWYPDGRHLLVSSATRTWLVGLSTVVDQVAVPGAAVTPLVGEALGLTTLTLNRSAPNPSEPLLLRRYDDEGRAALGEQVIDMSGAAPYRIETLSPRGWRMGNLTAQAANGRTGNGAGDFAFVVDDRTVTVTHVLDLGGDGGRGCCAVLGWQGMDVVVVRGADDLLLWRLSDGRVTQITDNAPGAMALAPSGCGWRVTIEQAMSACIS